MGTMLIQYVCLFCESNSGPLCQPSRHHPNFGSFSLTAPRRLLMLSLRTSQRQQLWVEAQTEGQEHWFRGHRPFLVVSGDMEVTILPTDRCSIRCGECSHSFHLLLRNPSAPGLRSYFSNALGPQNVFWALSTTPHGGPTPLHGLFLSNHPIPPFCAPHRSSQLPECLRSISLNTKNKGAFFLLEEQNHGRALMGSIPFCKVELRTNCIPELCQVLVYKVSKPLASLCWGLLVGEAGRSC